MALKGEKKVINERKKTLLGEKWIVLTMTQFIQKTNKKFRPKIHLIRRPNLTRGRGGSEVRTMSQL